MIFHANYSIISILNDFVLLDIEEASCSDYRFQALFRSHAAISSGDCESKYVLALELTMLRNQLLRNFGCIEHKRKHCEGNFKIILKSLQVSECLHSLVSLPSCLFYEPAILIPNKILLPSYIRDAVELIYANETLTASNFVETNNETFHMTQVLSSRL